MISRSFLAAVCLATSSFAAPPLTTIQDVLYKADGTPFHGTLTISWTSFEAIDRSAIEQQTTTVTVVNGNLQVQLVPTTTATPAAYYTVVYNSDGLVQFQETWAAPSRVAPAVRIGMDLWGRAAGEGGVVDPGREAGPDPRRCPFGGPLRRRRRGRARGHVEDGGSGIPGARPAVGEAEQPAGQSGGCQPVGPDAPRRVHADSLGDPPAAGDRSPGGLAHAAALGRAAVPRLD